MASKAEWKSRALAAEADCEALALTVDALGARAYRAETAAAYWQARAERDVQGRDACSEPVDAVGGLEPGELVQVPSGYRVVWKDDGGYTIEREQGRLERFAAARGW